MLVNRHYRTLHFYESAFYFKEKDAMVSLPITVNGLFNET
jgi:hypothetical protein